MAGRPKLNQLAARIEAEGGPESLFQFIAEGESVSKVMSRYGLSRYMFYDWLNLGTPEEQALKRKMYARAKQLSGEAHAERGLEILDELAEKTTITNPEVARANARANYRKWLAGVRDEQFRDKAQGGSVTVNINALHLDALRQHGSMPGGGPPTLPAEVVEGEGDDGPSRGPEGDGGADLDDPADVLDELQGA